MKNMKLKYIFITVLALAIAACAEFEDDALDFSNSLPQYVELSSGDEIESVEGSTVSFTVRVRETFPTDINVDYTVSGDVTASGTVTIAATTLSGDGSFTIPDDDALGTGGSAVITLTAVDNGLDLGRGGPTAGFSSLTRDVTWTEDVKEITFASADTVGILESETKLMFIVSSSLAVESNTSVTYTVSGDLTEGVDYSLDSPNPLVLASGESADTIEITLLEDFDNGVLDDGRDIFIALNSISGANAETSLKASQSQGFEIADDTITIAIVGDSTSAAGVSVVDIPVTIDGAGFDHDDVMTVNYSIAGGTAGVDYEDATGGSITFVSETTEVIRVRVLNEDDELDLFVTITGTDNPEGIIDTSSDEFKINVN